MVFSTPEIISQGDGLPLWCPVQEQLSRLVPKQPNTRPQVDQPTPQDTIKEVFISPPYIPGLSKEFRRILRTPKHKQYSRDVTLLNHY